MKNNSSRARRANFRLGEDPDSHVSKYQMFNQWYEDNLPWSYITVIIPAATILFLIAKIT